MKALISRVVGGAACVAVASALVPACAENNQSVFIRQVMAPNDACSFQADPEQPALPFGRLDVGVTDAYQPVILMGNQLINRQDRDLVRAESNRFVAQSATTRLFDGGNVIAEVTSPTAGIADAVESDADYGLALFVAIDPAGANALRGSLAAGEVRTVTVGMRIRGKTLGGTEIETDEYLFPVRVCNGCLVNFANADDPAVDGPDCRVPLSADSVLPCTLGQDQPTPCQVCQDRPACVPSGN